MEILERQELIISFIWFSPKFWNIPDLAFNLWASSTIKASKFSIFFIDESQRVTLKDIGSVEEIQKYIGRTNAESEIMELESQFRCNGSDGYIAWLDDVLDIRKTANSNGFDLDYDIKICDTPNEVRDIIFEKNKINNKARLLAGYCWNWIKEGKTIPSFWFNLFFR